jgi:hypothetical protein
VLVGIIVAIGFSHLLTMLGRPELALGVMIVFGLAEFFVVVWLFRDFFEPSAPTDADTEITSTPLSDTLAEMAREKADNHNE